MSHPLQGSVCSVHSRAPFLGCLQQCGLHASRYLFTVCVAVVVVLIVVSSHPGRAASGLKLICCIQGSPQNKSFWASRNVMLQGFLVPLVSFSKLRIITSSFDWTKNLPNSGDTRFCSAKSNTFGLIPFSPQLSKNGSSKVVESITLILVKRNFFGQFVYRFRFGFPSNVQWLVFLAFFPVHV